MAMILAFIVGAGLWVQRWKIGRWGN